MLLLEFCDQLSQSLALSTHTAALTDVSSLGDSGYVIIRSNSIFYQSPSQTHCFNCPKSGYLLYVSHCCTDGQHDILRQLAKGEKAFIEDPPSHADTHEVKLRDGDIVIVYVCYFLLH